MEIKIHNTLSKKIESFKPINNSKVTMYHCGPTVYDTPHIGNYRTFVLNDIIRRTFEYASYDVIQAMNITDVDDKTIKRSKDEHSSLLEVTSKYEALFFQGLDTLNINRPNILLRATENIPEMIDMISQLINKDFAYTGDDGVYMKIDSVKNYGKLAGLNIKSTDTKSRIANDEYDKDSARDFALWKFHTSDDGEVGWDAPFGKGRPGWHIECSAMSMKALGETIDIHTGGSDLIFPHHTNEIAQSECVTGKTFVNYWIHGGFMVIAEQKMSKSKGNTIKLDSLNEEAISPIGYRYWLLTSHYRSQVNFTFEAVKSAQNALIKLMSHVSAYPDGGTVLSAYKDKFEAFIGDDFNMPKAIALSWDLIKDQSASDADKKATLIDFDRVFGLDLANVPASTVEPVPAEINVLAEAREEARKSKDWKKADALREEIEARGFVVKDVEGGFEISS